MTDCLLTKMKNELWSSDRLRVQKLLNRLKADKTDCWVLVGTEIGESLRIVWLSMTKEIQYPKHAESLVGHIYFRDIPYRLPPVNKSVKTKTTLVFGIAYFIPPVDDGDVDNCRQKSAYPLIILNFDSSIIVKG